MGGWLAERSNSGPGKGRGREGEERGSVQGLSHGEVLDLPHFESGSTLETGQHAVLLFMRVHRVGIPTPGAGTSVAFSGKIAKASVHHGVAGGDEEDRGTRRGHTTPDQRRADAASPSQGASAPPSSIISPRTQGEQQQQKNLLLAAHHHVRVEDDFDQGVVRASRCALHVRRMVSSGALPSV